MIESDDPFRAVHRAHRRAVWARIIGLTAVLAIGLGLVSLADAVPTPTAAVAAASPPGVLPEPSPSVSEAFAPRAADEIPAPATLPVVPAAATAEAPALPAAPTNALGPASWQIAIDTVGYQTELDECLWVRMNLGVQAPIVGAHNYWGGDGRLRLVGLTVAAAD